MEIFIEIVDAIPDPDGPTPDPLREPEPVGV